MKPKTRQLIARIIVILLAVLMVLGALTPYIMGAEKFVNYSNNKLHMKMRIPSSAKSDMERPSENSREFPVDFHLTARVTYGDIYQETLDKYDLTKDELSREQIYIESEYTKKTWNDKKFINKYFKGILGDAKSDYTFEITKSKLSGIPAWRCYYKGKNTKSSGYYYLTVASGGLHVLQLDCYLESLSQYRNTVNKIKKSYKITNLVIPDPTKTQKDGKDNNLKADEKNVNESNADSKNNVDNNDNNKASKDQTGVSVFSYFIVGVAVIGVLGAVGAYVVRQKKFNKMKKKRKELRVKRRNNDKLD